MTEDRFTRMQQRVFGVVVEELQGMINDMIKGMINPSLVTEFMRSMGIDPSRLPGMTGFDPYQVLGLDKSASDEEVKKRYKELMSKIHPDKAGPETTFLSTMVNAAYEMIRKERRWN